MLLNIYYFRFNIFQKGTFKGFFEKIAHYQKTFFGEGGVVDALEMLWRACEKSFVDEKAFFIIFNGFD